MVKVPKDWERRLVELAAAHGIADFLLRGRLTALEGKALWKILSKVALPATRAGVVQGARMAGTGLAVGRLVAVSHPYLTAGAVIYVARDDIQDYLRRGYELDTRDLGIPEGISTPQDIVEAMRRDRGLKRPRGPGVGAGVKRGKTKFNRAISLGMKAVKKSKNGGKSGRLTSPKKTFATVTKTASKILKGRKVSNRGVTGTAARAMRKTLKGRGY